MTWRRSSTGSGLRGRKLPVFGLDGECSLAGLGERPRDEPRDTDGETLETFVGVIERNEGFGTGGRRLGSALSDRRGLATIPVSA